MEKTNKYINAKKYIKKHLSIKYNEGLHDFEISNMKNPEIKYNIYDLLIELNEKEINIRENELGHILKSRFIEKYNPIKSYFKNLQDWDGVDYISELASYFKINDSELFEYHLRKWLVRSIKTVFEEQYFNKHALIFVGKNQNIGKSTLCRFFCPTAIKKFSAENITLDKDGLTQLAINFLINLDELKLYSRKELSTIKSFMSKDYIKLRLPFDKTFTTLPRTCSFVGSTDNIEFLTDDRGNSRWLCFDVSEIDFDYSKRINMDDVYSQAYLLYKTGEFFCELTKEDIELNEQRNSKYLVRSIEFELLVKHFEKAEKELNNFKTATDLCDYIYENITRNFKLNTISMGKALNSLGYEQGRDNKTNRGYYIKPK